LTNSVLLLVSNRQARLAALQRQHQPLARGEDFKITPLAVANNNCPLLAASGFAENLLDVLVRCRSGSNISSLYKIGQRAWGVLFIERVLVYDRPHRPHILSVLVPKDSDSDKGEQNKRKSKDS
jgi:hypothetical protein